MTTGTTTTFEEVWVSEYGKFEADMEFRRARRRALFDRLFGGSARRAARADSSIIRTPDAKGTVCIDSIVGAVNGEGRATAGFPRLGRKLMEQWRRDYLDPEAGGVPLAVRSGPGGWYLMGGSLAIVRFETLRAKGSNRVHVVAWNPKVIDIAAMPGERADDECPGCAAS